MFAEVLGAAITNDAFHMTAPRPDGEKAARCLTLALADAEVAPHEVDYVNAHGSSTPLNDSTETLALKRAFGAKDSGWIIPGHGGILDRLDSLLFPMVFTYYYAALVHG